MKTDNFWKYFWVVIGSFLLVGIVGVGWLKFMYLNNPDDTTRALAVGVVFDPTKDPFENRSKEREALSLFSGYFYEDSMPFGFQDWSWGVDTDWRTNENIFEGSYAAKVNFLNPWAGIRLYNSSIDVSGYKTLNLAIYPELSLKNLYIEMYDRYGNSMGRQLISWYATNATLSANTWNYITIPLDNLLAPTNDGKEITGFSISSEGTGIAFIDSISLGKVETPHTKWVVPPELAPKPWIGSDPFTGIEQRNIPYSLSFTSGELGLWRNLFGQFESFEGGVHLGPISKKTNGSMVVFGGGRDWADYKVEARVYWGMTSTFSILVRFVNDANFVSCAYSDYGAVVQIYQVKGGVSTLISQSPQLAIRSYEPWNNADHGAQVKGNRVSCYMDKEKVLSATLSDMPKTGSVGLETWTKNSDDYPHKLLSLTVDPL